MERRGKGAPHRPYRGVVDVFSALRTFDSAGVRLYRTLGSKALEMLDPFLLLDEVVADDPGQKILGFLQHPHVGCETITYVLEGAWEYRSRSDLGGVVEAGGVHWLTAGAGTVHSEIPQRRQGSMRAFQWWLNLPRAEKQLPPREATLGADEIIEVALDSGGYIRILTGTFYEEARAIGPFDQRATAPMVLDVSMPPQDAVEIPVPAAHSVGLYVYEGSLTAPSALGKAVVSIPARSFATLVRYDCVGVTSGDEGARFLLMAGRPVREPMARRGAFFLNSDAELTAALEAHRAGRF